MTDTFEFTLNNPLTEEQWDMIADVDFEHTDRIWFHTKHGKEVEFAKVRYGKWYELATYDGGEVDLRCSNCGATVSGFVQEYKCCPYCECRMDAEEKKNER